MEEQMGGAGDAHAESTEAEMHQPHARVHLDWKPTLSIRLQTLTHPNVVDTKRP